MPDLRPTALVVDGAPLEGFASFVALATSVLATDGFSVDGRPGRSWAHWVRGGEIIRAYAFEDAEDAGVMFFGQGGVPDAVVESVAQEALNANAGWRRKPWRPQRPRETSRTRRWLRRRAG